MSKNFTVTFILSIILIIVGVEFAKTFLKRSEPREPANVRTGSIYLIEDKHEHKKIKATAKLTGPIQTTIKLNTEESFDSVKTFIGQVLSHRRLTNVLVRWQLPDDMSIVSGHRELVIAEILPDVPYELTIQVESKSELPLQIHLLASTTMGPQRMSHSSQYNIAGSKE